jgi:DNA-binding XRE family transcriptional regulator
MNDITKKTANKLKELRQQKGLTQADVATKAAINTNTYAKIERGEQAATVIMLEKIARVLGVEVRDVFDFEQ